MTFRRVIIESPYAGDVERNLRYLRRAMRDCVRRGESPYASHGLLTQTGVLDDLDPEERERGIAAGLAWQQVADVVVVYEDYGVSGGMRRALDLAAQHRVPVEMRRIGRNDG